MTVGAKSAKIECHQPDLDEMEITLEQQYALHVCKHEIAAAVHRLYLLVPQKKADKLIIKHVDQIIASQA